MTVTVTAMVIMMIRSSARLGAARPPSQPVHHDRTVTVQAAGGLSRGGLRVRGRLGADGGLGLGLRAGLRAGPTVAYVWSKSAGFHALHCLHSTINMHPPLFDIKCKLSHRSY
jgi:hypothetical protein